MPKPIDMALLNQTFPLPPREVICQRFFRGKRPLLSPELLEETLRILERHAEVNAWGVANVIDMAAYRVTRDNWEGQLLVLSDEVFDPLIDAIIADEETANEAKRVIARY